MWYICKHHTSLLLLRQYLPTAEIISRKMSEPLTSDQFCVFSLFTAPDLNVVCWCLTAMLCVSAGLCLQVKLQRCLPFKHKVSSSWPHLEQWPHLDSEIWDSDSDFFPSLVVIGCNNVKYSKFYVLKCIPTCRYMHSPVFTWIYMFTYCTDHRL